MHDGQDPIDYLALTPETLPTRIAAIPGIAARLGPAPWQVREIGDGNLNLVFDVEGPAGRLIVKQALPYVRLVGEGWPLPKRRAFFEWHALTRQSARDPGAVPEVHHFDEVQALIVMEHLSPHAILRGQLIAGERIAGMGARLGAFCARTAFRGSDLSMPAAERKADAALFLGNHEMCGLTEALVFTDPYHDAPRNRHTSGLGPAADALRADPAVAVAAQAMLARFMTGAETMVHGDLHTGSVMTGGDDLKVIDPEFAFYGPMGFDPGMLTANLLMSYLSQPGHRNSVDLAPYQDWLLDELTAVWDALRSEFETLWDTERTGTLHPCALYEDRGVTSAPARDATLTAIWNDAIGFAGVEMHRRVLTLAHNADFERIDDVTLRARLETRNLRLGARLLTERASMPGIAALITAARAANDEDIP